MTDFTKIFNIYSNETEPIDENENFHSAKPKRLNAGVNQDFSKDYVRLTMKIPQLKTVLNWRTLTRDTKNGLTTRATYHGTRVYFEFIIDQGKSTETTYEYSSNEPFRGPIEYKKSYLKYKDEYVIWFVHKSHPW